MDGTTLGLLIVNGATLLTVLGGFVAVEIRTRRERKWFVQDRDYQTQKIAEKLDANKAEVLQQTTANIKSNESKIDEIHRSQKNNIAKVQSSIKENTQISVKAFDQANSVNEKIASGIERTAALEGRFDGLEEVLFNLEETIHRALPHAPRDQEPKVDMTATDIFVESSAQRTPKVVARKRTKR